MTIRAGVVGNPVAHTMSPMIHAAWIEAAGLDADYGKFLLPLDGFRAGIQDLAKQLRGVNVTIPFKEQALGVADWAEPLAAASGAANLLLFNADGIEARNTDGLGMLVALTEQAPKFEIANQPVVLLGAGGAARGALAALLQAGAPEVYILNRTLERAETLADMDKRAFALPLGWAAEAFEEAGLVINATSVGLSGVDDLDLPLDALPESAVVMDMVYRPLQTGLLRAARARGLLCVDGLAMLIGQAVPSFEAFYGRPPPAQVDVRSICLKALGQTETAP